jgi:hypothetical protein
MRLSAVSARVKFSFAGFAVLVAGMSILSSSAWAQATSTSTVSGVVTDQQKAAVAGAVVKLLDPSTNQAATTTTNDAGRYIFVNVNSGTYSLSVTKSGFSVFVTDALPVTIGESVTVNAVLQVGSTTTVIEVIATAGAELVTTNAAVGTTLSGDALQDLPNMGRDVSTLAVLQPGTTLTGFTAGSYNDQNTYQIDGGNATDDMAGNVTAYQTNFTGLGGTQTGGAPSANVPTPVESVEEFKVNTFNQTADFNNSIGGQVQIATKRGTNQWHGSGYGYYYATDLGAANSWANDHTLTSSGVATPIVKNHRSRFGTSLGGPMTPRVLGGKTYFFFNYEGERFPNGASYERLVPTPLMKLGVIQVPNAAGQYIAYNLNPNPVTYNGVTYQPAQCGTGLCDPRGIGINPVVSTIWNKYMPNANDYTGSTGDAINTAGFLSSVRAPLTSNAFVGRVDHDFGANWRLMSSYRYARIINLTNNQVDIGGFFSGDTLGQPVATAPRPQLPSFLVVGLTGTIRPNLISDFRFSYQREFWQWGDQNAPPQVPGLGGAVEIAPGNSTAPESTNALIPYNVNTQSIRQRFWDAHDAYFREDLTWIKGKHLIQYGGAYQRNFDFHTRTDNGVGTNNQLVYWLGSTYINWANSPYIPSTVPSSQAALYQNLYSEVLGLVTQSQLAYTRSGNNLALNPPGSSAFDKSTIPYYSVYYSDTVKLKPNLTATYSLGYSLEMPPTEATGKQVMVVDSAGNPVDVQGFIDQRRNAALLGQVYNPTLGFATVGNVGSGRKYPYNPFYGEWSPRGSLAWNPHFTDGILGKIVGNGLTVIRGGYSRIWGRTNGVTQVLTPLLGVGLIQGVVCQNPTKAGTCAGASGVDPSNAFRIGVDGNSPFLPSASPTLAQPFFPGANGNATASDTSALDPNYKPQRTDNFTISIQRQITQKSILEVGYIGRIIRNETLATNLDAVPYMMTLGGQQFSQAYAATYFALAAGTAAANIPVQPFFENALGGASSASCKAYSSCTAYVAATQTSLIKNAQVSDLWAALNKTASWTLGRTMISSPALGTAINAQAASIDIQSSLGYGNYNALYVHWTARDFHHVTILSNFTYGKSLGTAALAQYNSSYTQFDAFNLHANYGVANFDYKFLYNLAATYKTPWFSTQKGIIGRVLGGYSVSPLFTAQSGAPVCVGYAAGSQNQAFGQSSSSSITGPNYSTGDCALPINPGTKYQFSEYQNTGSNGVGTNNTTALNVFADPAAVANNLRRCILGFDTSCGGGYGNMRGLPTWNLDASVVKDIGVWKEGRVGATLSFQFTNILNHFQPSNPSPSITTLTTFGKITGASNTPRNLEMGLRVHF